MDKKVNRKNLYRRTRRLMKKPVQTLAEIEAIRSRGISPVLYHGNVTGWQKSGSGKKVDPESRNPGGDKPGD